MTFSGIIGQEKVQSMLLDAIESDRLGHAYLFNGSEGIGRKTIAMQFARLIMCTGNKVNGSCGICDSCKLLDNNNNPDIKQVTLTKGKDSISVDTIREMQADLITAPVYSTKKVIIIHPSEKMGIQAQNAMLKTLEEPPEYVVIILICANINLILNTIKSRVIKIDFTRYKNEQIMEAYIIENAKPYANPEFMYAYADGIIGRAMHLKDFNESLELSSQLFEFIQQLGSGGYLIRKKMSEFFEKNNKKNEYIFFSLISFYRDIAMCIRFGKMARLLNENNRLALFEMSMTLSYSKLQERITIIDNTWKILGRNANYKIAVDTMLIKLQEENHD